jgi:hypothetical protein
VRRSHTYSPQALDAARVLGLRIAEGRRQRRWTQAELCERIIETQWRDAADAARLTELERQQLFRREILNEFAFRN